MDCATRLATETHCERDICERCNFSNREKFCLWSLVVFLSCLTISCSCTLVITIQRLENLERQRCNNNDTNYGSENQLSETNEEYTELYKQFRSESSRRLYHQKHFPETENLKFAFLNKTKSSEASRGQKKSRILRAINQNNRNVTKERVNVIKVIMTDANESRKNVKENSHLTSQTARSVITKRFMINDRSKVVRSAPPGDDRFKLYAAHFVSPDERAEFQYTRVKCTQKWNGTFCRNSTYWSTHPNQRIYFLQPADWMKTSNEQQSLEQITPGNFQTQRAGMFLLYLNVMIQATAVKHDVGIYLGQRRLLNCREGLDIVRNGGGDRFHYSQSRTCSVSGVFYLSAGQILSVNIQNPLTTVVLHPDSTNFGALLFVDTWSEDPDVNVPYLDGLG